MSAKALIVDDSSITRRVISLVLNSQKVDTREASNGIDGLSILQREPSIGVALVDWNMPRMNGLQFLREVRSRPELKNLKLIVVSANDTEETFKLARQAGADDFIVKPISKSVLAEKLRHHGFN